jgi:hypothetical protein
MLSIGNWISIVAILVALVSPIALYFKTKSNAQKHEGYMKRQLEDLESNVQKSFEHHKIHFAHASQTDIHQKSMDEKLIASKFDNVNQRIDGLSQVITVQMGSLSQRLQELATAINNSKAPS